MGIYIGKWGVFFRHVIVQRQQYKKGSHTETLHINNALCVVLLNTPYLPTYIQVLLF